MVAYSFQKRFVTPIRYGLNLMPMGKEGWMPCECVIEPGQRNAVPFDPFKHLEPTALPKRQTIRALGKRRHARPGEILQLYTGMRTPQCMKIGEARCTAVSDVVIAFGRATRPSFFGSVISINGEARYMGDGLNHFANLDGFEDWPDMVSFWDETHGITERAFSGVLIEWEPLT